MFPDCSCVDPPAQIPHIAGLSGLKNLRVLEPQGFILEASIRDPRALNKGMFGGVAGRDSLQTLDVEGNETSNWGDIP